MTDHGAVATIERVLAAGVLEPGLVTVASRGATQDELAAEAATLDRRLSADHRAILERWNGLDLDVVRLYGCGQVENGLRRLAAEQRSWPELRGMLVFGSDPAGFIYAESESGEVWTVDTKGGGDRPCAPNIGAFITDYVFGSRAASFGGAEWSASLARAGLLASRSQ